MADKLGTPDVEIERQSPLGPVFQPGSHGSTFGGTPLACAAGLAVLDVIEREQLLEKVRARSAGWASTE